MGFIFYDNQIQYGIFYKGQDSNFIVEVFFFFKIAIYHDRSFRIMGN